MNNFGSYNSSGPEAYAEPKKTMGLGSNYQNRLNFVILSQSVKFERGFHIQTELFASRYLEHGLHDFFLTQSITIST